MRLNAQFLGTNVLPGFRLDDLSCTQLHQMIKMIVHILELVDGCLFIYDAIKNLDSMLVSLLPVINVVYIICLLSLYLY